jgi:hypothetical protein
VQERAGDAPKRAYKKQMMAPGFGSAGPMPPPPAAAYAAAPMNCAYQNTCAFEPCCAEATADAYVEQQHQFQPPGLAAEAPVLGFLKHPAVVLAGLEPSKDGSVDLPAEQLQQLLANSAAAALSEGSTSGGSCDASSSSSMLGPGGFAVVYVFAYDLQQPGQFCSCIAAVQGAAPPEAAAASEGRRDMGLTADVDDDAVCVLVSSKFYSLLSRTCMCWCK